MLYSRVKANASQGIRSGLSFGPAHFATSLCRGAAPLRPPQQANSFFSGELQPLARRRLLAADPDDSGPEAIFRAPRRTRVGFSSRRDPKEASPAFQNFCIALSAESGNRDAARWKVRCCRPV